MKSFLFKMLLLSSVLLGGVFFMASSGSVPWSVVQVTPTPSPVQITISPVEVHVPTLPNKEDIACTMDAKECPDGTFVGRVPPSCEFAICPGGNLSMSNPASVSCKEKGGRSEILTSPDGSQTGRCIFPDGKSCEEWEFYRTGNCL